jgi:DNA-binding SARP family transcriptional activator/energy-coupling factor transporter ATP-binding protein EcfA2
LLHIHLFGIPQLVVDGEPLKFAARPRTWPLLGYLLLHRHQAVPREPTAFLLWPDDTEEEARANLRRHLNELQKHLPPAPPDRPWVVTEGATIRFNPDAQYWLDAAEFERLTSSPGTLAEAVGLYRGDLLENVADEWVYSERERYRGAFLSALGQLIQQKRSDRQFPQAAGYAERLLVHDPLREDAARQLIALRYEAGDRAGALRAYEQFGKRLREELDVDPMPETVALRDAIVRNAAIPGAGVALPELGDDRLARISFPLVGRETEIEQLRSWWSRAARGRGQAVLIGGEAGIGKSRLVAALALVAQAQGGRVLSGSTAFAEATPYQAIAEAVRSALPLIASLDVNPIRLAALSQLVPELHTRSMPLPALAPLAPEREQTRLFDALAACLEAMAAPRPLLLVLEDLHWAGAATVAALEFLARSSAHHPILIVATYRDEETPRAHPLRDVRRRLQQEKALTHIALGRLPLEAVEALVRQVPALSPPLGELSRRLYFESEGNPFFLGEIIRDRIEAAEGPLPGSIQATIFARVARLSAPARSLSEVAAVVGRAFDIELLREVCGWEEGPILDALSELLDRHLVREIGGRTQVDYAFTHHLIQSAIYDGMSEDSRRHRHRRIAAVIEELYAEKAQEFSAELARHWERGAEPQRAARHYLTAAKRALAVFAVDEARGYLDLGVQLAREPDLLTELHLLRAGVRRQLADRSGEREDLDVLDRFAQDAGDEELVCEVLLRRVRLVRALGERDAEAQLIASLRSHAERNGDLRWKARALQAEAMHLVFVGGFDDAAQAASTALSLHRTLGNTVEELECICLLAEITARRGTLEETQALLAEAQTCAKSIPNPSLIGRATIAAARAGCIRQDYGVAGELAHAALDLYRTACDREGEADALYCSGGVAIGLSRFDDARRFNAQAAEIYRAIGHRRGVANVAMDTAVVESGLGLIADAERSIEKATALFEAVRDLRGRTMCAIYLSDFRRIAGDTTGAKESAQRAVELARALRIPSLEATAIANLGDAERDAGETSAAIDHLETAVAMLRGQHRPLDYVELLAGLAVAYVRARDVESARTVLEELLTHEASIESAHRPQYCFWAAAQVYRACAQKDRCVQMLRRSHAILEASAAAMDDARTRVAYLSQPFNCEIVAAQTRDTWPAYLS